MPNLFDNATNTQGVIVYGGESSSDYGMVVAEAPAYERPKRKQTIYNVPGRNGSIIFQQDAWEDVNRSYKVWLAEDANDTLVEKVDAFEAWLNSQNGYVRLEDNFEPDVFRLAYYSGGDGFSNSLTQYGEATINFTCRPERFLKSGENAIPINLTGVSPIYFTVNNPTKFASKPLFNITANGVNDLTFKIYIGAKSLTVDLRGISAPITIDCQTMNLYYTGGFICNNLISGTFPVISPGQGRGRIEIVTGSLSDITSATYTPRYFKI